MCGVTGYIRFKGKGDATVLQHMNNAIRHRGYDDEGFVCVDEENRIKLYSGEDSMPEIKNSYPHIRTAPSSALGLGFRRLSIIDLSHCGHQPMLSADGQIALTFNGEIYNYKELRQELQELGYSFTSTSDTEVILQGYRHWGKKVLDRLNGMFAIVIYDSTNHTLFIARDRMGIKPLFYHQSAEGFTWASEMKAILKAPWVQPHTDWQGLFMNYQLQTTPSPQTCFQNILSLQPGYWMEIDVRKQSMRLERYWQIPVDNQHINISKQEAADELDRRLQHAVSLQLRSDVPVTSLMSGGMDSTTLTAICAAQNPDFRCYSLGFDGSGEGADELPQAIEMAKKLGIKQYVHHIKPADIVDGLDDTLKHFEEPYFTLETGVVVSEYLNKQGYKVVMNGLGADEVFGGYAHYIDYKKWLNRKKLLFVEALIPPVNEMSKKLKNYLSLGTAFKYFVNSRLGMRNYEIGELSNKSFIPLGEYLHEEKIEELNSIPERLFYYDLKYYIGSHHVYRDDMGGMKYNLEVRYPFLDHELIEWVAALPLPIRYDSMTRKPLLKEVAKRYITDTSLNMPKRGFNLPLDEWMKHDSTIQGYARTKLDALKKRNIFNNATIESWWQQRDAGAYFSKIWQLVTTEVWLNEYVER
jgi:asparagine synthase (glutamine-hydrolysing)